MATNTGEVMLEMRNITKRFPGVLANDSVNFDVRAGEVHTLLGENGAGKSTLMKVLFGLYQPEEGEILLNGTPTKITSPTHAINQRIGMIHQHFMLVPTLTVAENVALGLKSGRRPLTDLKAVARGIADISDEYGLAVDPNVDIWRLSVGERQRVEIIKALYRKAELLVLDEPTAVLTPQEVDELFAILRDMRNSGKGLVFISHKLHEVMALSDRITVLRNGKVTGATTPAESDRSKLASMMVGREVKLAPDKPLVEIGKPRLTISNLSVDGDRGAVAVDGVDLEIRAGEILGIAGVSGNGQRELAEAIAGLRSVKSGSTISIDGKDVAGMDTRDRRNAGLSYVPEERMRDGAIGDFTVAENLILVDHGSDEFSARGMFKFAEIETHCSQLVSDYAVKTPSLETPTSSLSGGNIQKIILARELANEPSVMIASQPTRGVDIGAAEYIHSRLVDARDRGMATMVISEDLDEVLGLADRIAVLCDGKVMDIVPVEGATKEQLGLLMAGVKS